MMVGLLTHICITRPQWAKDPWKVSFEHIKAPHSVFNSKTYMLKIKPAHRGGSLLWRHNWRNSVSNHQHHDCFLKRLFRRSSKQTNIKAPRHWPLWGEFTGDRWSLRTNGQLRGFFFPFHDVIIFFWKPREGVIYSDCGSRYFCGLIRL